MEKYDFFSVATDHWEPWPVNQPLASHPPLRRHNSLRAIFVQKSSPPTFVGFLDWVYRYKLVFNLTMLGWYPSHCGSDSSSFNSYRIVGHQQGVAMYSFSAVLLISRFCWFLQVNCVFLFSKYFLVYPSSFYLADLILVPLFQFSLFP